jgi:hypothetical protein
MKMSAISILVSALFLFGCGGSDSSSSFSDLNGNYNLAATSTTDQDVYGGSCGNAEGTMTVNDSSLSGTLIDTWGNMYDILGEIDNNGNISGGFALSQGNVATFSGTISGNTLTGTWSDIYQCSGDWQATII